MRTYSFSFGSGTPVRLYTFTRVDGTVIRITSWDKPITVGGHTWVPAVGLTEYAISEKNDGTPASTQVTVASYTGGSFDPSDIAQRMFENALLEIDVTNAESPTALDFHFIGKVSITEQSVYNSVTFEARNHFAFPIRQLVENYALMCLRNFSDVFCGVDATTFQASCTVASVVDLHNVTLTSLPDARASVDGWYNPGRITFTSGRNKNRVFRIGFWQASPLQVTTFLPVGICTRSGDTAIIRPDCDKTIGMCGTKYSNQAKHGGFPRYAGAKAAATSDF